MPAPEAEPSVVILGARSVRQGTGPFIAAALAKGGARVAGIVGTTAGTVKEARKALSADWGIDCQGFVSLRDALSTTQADAVAICTPWELHEEQLLQVAAAGCHCLVEKPLLWPGSEGRAHEVIKAFEDRQLLLDMVAQWPATLAGFEQLHGALPEPLDEFVMRLSPLALGERAIPDAAPHFISMLQALLGPGECVQVNRGIRDDRIQLGCNYYHTTGICRAMLILEACPERPRPAWYQLNSLRADREVELPEYRQYLEADGDRVAIPDPMEQVANNFLDKLAVADRTDGASLRAAHRNLLQLVG